MKSENISDLATALAKAQSEMKDAVLSKVNPHFKNKYADLPAVREAITAPLTKNGIAVTQTMDADENGRSYIVTTLMHTSGQWISGRTPILVEKTTMQALGSGITCARRYALAAICGIASDEDDDAEAADHSTKDAKVEKNPPGITAFRQESREFYKELYACTDYDQYIAFIGQPNVKAFLKKVQTEFAKDWLGDGGDVKGIKEDMRIFCERLKATKEPTE